MWKRRPVIAAVALFLSGCAGQGTSTPTPTPETSSEIQSIDYKHVDHDLDEQRKQWKVSYDAASDTVVILGDQSGENSSCHEQFLREATYDTAEETLQITTVIVKMDPSPQGCSAAGGSWEYRAEIVLNDVPLRAVQITHINNEVTTEDVTIEVS
jgi:hypothetical protein